MRAFVFSLFVGIGAFVATGEISAQRGGAQPSAVAQATADKVDHLGTAE
jgi:hypothetical protein